jgi:hypothetical protein
MRRLNPTMSAAKIAASLRSTPADSMPLPASSDAKV